MKSQLAVAGAIHIIYFINEDTLSSFFLPYNSS